jgi:hypothetical protein
MSKRLLLYISLSIAFCNALIAQEEFIEPAAKYLTRVHFTPVNRRSHFIAGAVWQFS